MPLEILWTCIIMQRFGDSTSVEECYLEDSFAVFVPACVSSTSFLWTKFNIQFMPQAINTSQASLIISANKPTKAGLFQIGDPSYVMFTSVPNSSLLKWPGQNLQNWALLGNFVQHIVQRIFTFQEKIAFCCFGVTQIEQKSYACHVGWN